MRNRVGIALAILMLVSALASCAPAAPASPAPAPGPKPATAAPTAPAKPAAPATAAPREKTTVRLFASGVGASYWVYFTAMAFLAEKHSPWLRFEVVPTKGLGEALLFLLQKKGAVAGTKIFNIQASYKGEDEYKALGPTKDAQLITTMAQTAMTAVVLDKSPIKAWTYADLKGKKLAVREIGSAGVVYALAYLRAVGLDPEKDVRLIHGGLADCLSAVLDGTADVYASSAGHPQPALDDMTSSKPCRFLPFSREVIAKVNEAGMDQVPVAMPANSYKGQKEPVLLGAEAGWAVTRADVSDDIVYELTRLWWEYMDERNEISDVIARFGTVDALKAAENVAVPYHKAALKYYREKGWFK
ncbi:MAG: TAXI family TRAP transporter solute-binding subunit [Chloroflexota bacterium]